MWSPFDSSSSFAPWALWHSPVPAPHAPAHKDAHAHAAASEKHSTLMSLLSLPLIRKRFLEALPSWLHHSESRTDATHLDFLETEDAMKVSARGLRSGLEGNHFQALSCRCACSRTRTAT